MRKMRFTAMGLALLTVLTLTGGPSLAESADTARTVTGRVTAVSASSITMELGTYTAPARHGTPDASSSATVKPEATPALDSSAAPGTTAAPDSSAIPEATAAPEAGAPLDGQQEDGPDQGNPPEDGQQPEVPEQGTQSANSSFTASGETLTFSITSSTTFYFEGRKRQASLSEIPVGTLLTVQLNGDQATAVTILVSRGVFLRDDRGFSGRGRMNRSFRSMPGRNRRGFRDGNGRMSGPQSGDNDAWRDGPQGSMPGGNGQNGPENAPSAGSNEENAAPGA